MKPNNRRNSDNKVVELTAPITEEQIRALKVGDVVKITGRMYTGRDAIHHHLMSHDAPVDLKWSNYLSLWSSNGKRRRR